MRNSKLYSILKAINKVEENQLRRYLLSPYFNVNESIISLFEYLTDSLQESSDEDFPLDKKSIWRVISPGEKYNDVRFRKYCSDLLKLIEGFLSQQVFEKNELYQHLFLMEAVGKRKLAKLYNGAVKKAERALEKSPYRSAQFFFNRYRYERSFFNLYEFETKRDEKSNLEEIIRNLDIFYISEKLRLYCSALSRQRILSFEYKVEFIQEILEYLAQNPEYLEQPSIAIYYQIQLIYTAPENEEHYFKLKDLLGRYSQLFPIREAQEELYIPPINYCIRKVNQGSQVFLEELFHLYKELIEKGVFITGGQLSPWHFRNIIFVGLKLRHFDWTESFIRNYKDYLPESFRDNAVTFNLARLFWYQQRYDKVIEQLREVEYEDVTYNLGSKSMLLATYYEMEEIEALYSLLDSFRVYLNRNKDIPESRRINYKNLIKFTKKLIKIRPGDQSRLKKLKEEVIETKNVASIDWLKEKIAELE
jgi:hypothetical protein